MTMKTDSSMKEHKIRVKAVCNVFWERGKSKHISFDQYVLYKVYLMAMSHGILSMY